MVYKEVSHIPEISKSQNSDILVAMNGPRGMEQVCVNIGKLSEEEVIIKLETYGLRVSARLNLEQEGEEIKLREKFETFWDSTNQGLCVYINWAQ